MTLASLDVENRLNKVPVEEVISKISDYIYKRLSISAPKIRPVAVRKLLLVYTENDH